MYFGHFWVDQLGNRRIQWNDIENGFIFKNGPYVIDNNVIAQNNLIAQNLQAFLAMNLAAFGLTIAQTQLWTPWRIQDGPHNTEQDHPEDDTPENTEPPSMPTPIVPIERPTIPADPVPSPPTFDPGHTIPGTYTGGITTYWQPLENRGGGGSGDPGGAAAELVSKCLTNAAIAGLGAALLFSAV